ncbi:MAG: HEAT repeat domain-containing protein [Phycisphaerae bacterium]|nr:HEAT repeat domain-containing protein [Phycisphaerae bacterium]
MKSSICFCITVLCISLAGCENNQLGLGSAPAVNGLAAKPIVRIQTLKPQALAILKKGLGHENAYIRGHAVEVVAASNCREMMPEILTRLQDSSTAVRFAAASAIGDMRCFGYEKQVEMLLDDANENVQIAAAYALVRLNQPVYHAKIRQATQHSDQTVRANAVLLLGKLGNRDDLDLLYGVLYDADSLDKVRLQTVESIARLGDERIYRSKLWALLISKYADDRVMGIRGMGALGTSEARNAILTMLQDDVLEVKLAAAEQLGQLGDPRGEEEVYRYFQSGPDLNQATMANNMAIMAIGRIDSALFKAYLPDALASQSEYIRLLAAQSVLLLTR